MHEQVSVIYVIFKHNIINKWQLLNPAVLPLESIIFTVKVKQRRGFPFVVIIFVPDELYHVPIGNHAFIGSIWCLWICNKSNKCFMSREFKQLLIVEHIPCLECSFDM